MGTLREIESLKKIIENYKQEIEEFKKSLLSCASLLHIAKKEIKEKEKINCKLSNEISVLECENKTLNSLIEEKDKIITQKDLIILKYQKEKY